LSLIACTLSSSSSTCWCPFNVLDKLLNTSHGKTRFSLASLHYQFTIVVHPAKEINSFTELWGGLFWK
jgi:hypothetical protein